MIYREAGSGKTIYCHNLFSRLLEQKSPYLPIYIYLTDFANNIRFDLLEKAFDVLEIDNKTNEIRTKKRSLLDGYNKMSEEHFLVQNKIRS